MTPWRNKNCALIFFLALSACGQLQSAKVNQDSIKSFAVKAPLSAKDAEEKCAALGGTIEMDGTYCISIKTGTSSLAQGMNQITTSGMAEISSLVTIGQAIQTFGSVTNNAVDVYLDGMRLASIPSSRPIVIPQNGRLTYHYRPGMAQNIQTSIYTCYLAANMGAIACPF